MPDHSPTPFTLPNYHRVRAVDSFEELLSSRFANGINAICWQRQLDGDFDEIVTCIGELDEITTIDQDDLLGLNLSTQGKLARDVLIRDLNTLSKKGLDPSLDIIPNYPRSSDSLPLPTDVYSFHADSAPVEAYTYLCSYNQAASEGLPNEDAVLRAELLENRRKLLSHYDGPEGVGFEEYLKENFYNLHYEAKSKRNTHYSFGLGNMWRIATDYPDSPVPPCIHRAPTTAEGAPARLLLIC